RWILIALMLFAIALVLGTRFSLFNLFESGGQNFHSIEMFRLTDNSGIFSSAISPDGRFVAFVEQKEGRGTLFVKQILTGVTITIVPPILMQFYQPTFTPDSEFIYYVGVTEEGVGTLYQVSVLGGESKKIVTDVDSNVTFSPDGKRLAFNRHNPNEGGDTIFIMNSDGTNLEPFLETKEAGFDNFGGMEWSPDGERLLVGGFKNVRETGQRSKLLTIELKDKKISEFAVEKNWHTLRMFKWLKNGTGILLIARATSSENSQIWYLDYPQGTVRQITSDTSNYGSLSISSDGGSIVATRVEIISSLWSLNPQSKVMKQLMSENNYLIGSNQMSQLPDGKIIFVKSSGKELDIFSIGESGGEEQQLTSKIGVNQNPAASPDGKYIVFSSNRTGTFALWRMNPDGGGATQLTNAENATDDQPQITPDGQTVIFARRTLSGGYSKLMKISIDGGEASVLLPENNTSEVYPRISPDGRRFGFLGYVYENQTANMNSTVKIIGFEGDKPDKSIKESHLNINGDFKWSPDSESLIYVKKSGIDNISSISINDGKETPLTDFNSGNITDFIWSTDGKTIIFIKAVYNNNLVLIKDKGKKIDSKIESLAE
ncbi:MAG TPA: hypothetical protein VNB22_12320, partial [Pyrinomonadaceae bacterium]|nr:hypothetical protein [Pyrinomonadaceae bacterium]